MVAVEVDEMVDKYIALGVVDQIELAHTAFPRESGP